MIIKGKYNEAKVFTDNLEDGARRQIIELLDQEFVKGSKIRIMPDVHMGAGSVIGTTMTITDKVVPNLVGVDIGCGLIVVELKDKEIDFEKLDTTIRQLIPSGFNIRDKRHVNARSVDLEKLRCVRHVDLDRGYKSIGTLGGGNHFIEVNNDLDGKYYLVIHSGSRNIGLQTAKHYQSLAQKEVTDVPKDLAYLTGKNMRNYLHDMKIIQEYAYLNRKTMADIIVEAMGFDVVNSFQTIHNYIDLENMILRKGAVSAQKNEKFIIPFNMRDGSVILKGKGNEDWNYSAPHGAGRVISRRAAKRKFALKEFKKEMEEVYSTSVTSQTIDEAPMAYKDKADIMKHIGETAEVVNWLKAVYNFKAN